MRLVADLFALPTSILLLISALPASSGSTNRQWPYNLPSHIKYYPEDEVHMRRELDVEQRLAIQPPAGVRKMGIDEGEKFFLDYWQFDGQSESDISYLQPSQEIDDPELWERREAIPHRPQPRARDENDLQEYANASIPFPFRPSFPPHTNDRSFLQHQRRWIPRAFFSTLSNRAFTSVVRKGKLVSL
ncbi:MAG: hypothetical protein M1835_004132 [Candelina submexicana]|nr:MAG: hypothetical protein M1835_004132 [Candelina submexicana]